MKTPLGEFCAGEGLHATLQVSLQHPKVAIYSAAFMAALLFAVLQSANGTPLVTRLAPLNC